MLLIVHPTQGGYWTPSRHKEELLGTLALRRRNYLVGKQLSAFYLFVGSRNLKHVQLKFYLADVTVHPISNFLVLMIYSLCRLTW